MKTFNISNRRYLGGKAHMLDLIAQVVHEHTHGCKSFADLFAGTGVVAHHFNPSFDIVVNDLLACNHHAYVCFFSPVPYDKDLVLHLLTHYNQATNLGDNYYSQTFGNTYLSTQNLQKVGFMRDDLDRKLKEKEINEREYSILLTSLLYAIDRIANTVGHYDAYRKNGELDTPLELRMPLIGNTHNTHNQIFNMDANALAKCLVADIVYLDPPYNSRQYANAYHFLENIARNTKPPVFGSAGKMDLSTLRSQYCLKDAKMHFKELIDSLQARYILFSYNNTHSANPRSNTKISDADILEILGQKGMVSVFSKDCAPFSAGKSAIANHQERLFLCAVHPHKLKASLKNPQTKTALDPITP
ncbi:Adenine-specific methyltransferase [Helicobacter heilmannii]|uniref:DNA adenine methylase n=1 Tax=Helicobacter heilmannii TaxID=35817 RepID=UPI0006A23A56|nr:DNA adenine methylase [Helicobacter heilmannii]CRF47877.1 Adenine-specific methyltransferase [Helicobacter heilmannii]CRF50301.1 Adenine-specific methyltransferase [Helicobacter heilmannii]